MRVLVKLVLWFAVLFGGALGILRATCLDFWTIPGDDPLLSASIVPTLEAGDVVVLWRSGTPGFSDVVRCVDPEAPGRFVIGRIMAEQGDDIRVDNAHVTVNGKSISTTHVCATAHPTMHDPRSGDPVQLTCEIEEAGGVAFTRARATDPPYLSPPVEQNVQSGQVFLVSDDRYFHDDSRDFGGIAKSTCHERIVFRLWSARGWFDSERRLSLIH